jgi:Raf kinase inhibitor-like YbhB/YbcL family protein
MKKIIFSVIILLVLIGIFIEIFNYLSLKNKSRPQINILNMKISSSDFLNNEFIPSKFTCDGEDLNPELQISEVPENAKSLVLIMDDPDAPVGIFTHWTVWNILPDTKIIKSGELPQGALEGLTDFGRIGYGGPCPPSGKPHRYFFKIYALDTILNLKAGALRTELEKAIENHIIGQAEFFGLYQR